MEELNNKLLLISYNEGEQDFYNRDNTKFGKYDYTQIIQGGDLKNIKNMITEKLPDIIFICTQKSKSQVVIALPGSSLTGSNSTKHFPHVLGKYLIANGYKNIYKKDASFIIRGVTQNNNVRTRIYQKINTSASLQLSLGKNKLSSNTIGQLSTLTVNRQAIYNELVINDKKLIVVNTELSSSDSVNFGESDRRKEFLSLVKEFELHKRYDEGYNIIFCGSLNFRLKNMYKIINNQSRIDLYNMIHGDLKQKINEKKELVEANQLKLYMNNIVKELKLNSKQINPQTSNSAPDILGKLKKIDNMYISLFEKFSDSITNVGFTQDCGFNSGNIASTISIMKMGSVANLVSKSFDNAHSVYKTENKSKLGVATGFLKGLVTGIGSTVKRSSDVINKTKEYPKSDQIKKEFKLPAMCDKIIFALHENNMSYSEFGIINDLTKSKRRPIYAIFNL
jgi:predicted nucleic acid-binding protein